MAAGIATLGLDDFETQCTLGREMNRIGQFITAQCKRDGVPAGVNQERGHYARGLIFPRLGWRNMFRKSDKESLAILLVKVKVGDYTEGDVPVQPISKRAAEGLMDGEPGSDPAGRIQDACPNAVSEVARFARQRCSSTKMLLMYVSA